MAFIFPVCMCLFLQACLCFQIETRGRFKSLLQLFLNPYFWRHGLLLKLGPPGLARLYVHLRSGEAPAPSSRWLVYRCIPVCLAYKVNTGNPRSLSWLHNPPNPVWTARWALRKLLLQAGGSHFYFSQEGSFLQLCLYVAELWDVKLKILNYEVWGYLLWHGAKAILRLLIVRLPGLKSVMFLQYFSYETNN